VHELSIAHAVVDAVVEAAGRARVSQVDLRVGGLSGVVPDALRFSFEVAAQGTVCEGAALVVEEVPVTVWCDRCAALGAIGPPLRFRCPTCGELTADVRGGRELDLVSITVAEEALA
jgi:hydrogenase nickel incorporation protein HypA/HybF